MEISPAFPLFLRCACMWDVKGKRNSTIPFYIIGRACTRFSEEPWYFSDWASSQYACMKHWSIAQPPARACVIDSRMSFFHLLLQTQSLSTFCRDGMKGFCCLNKQRRDRACTRIWSFHQMRGVNDVRRIRRLLSFGKVEIFICVSDLCL